MYNKISNFTFFRKVFIMTLQKVSITENIRLSYISTKKFKSELISFSLSAPITERSYLLSLVLCGVLRRGTNALPSMALINKRLDELYASTVDIQSSIHADVLTLCVSAEILSQRFSLDGTDILGGVTDTVADILLSPLTEDGCFPAKTVESEIAFVKDSLSAEINNTRLYASTRLKELMCRGEDSRFPTLEYLLSNVETVTPSELWDFYNSMLCSRLSVFYIGSQTPSEISDRVKKAFEDFCGERINEFIIPRASAPKEFLSVTEDMPVNQGKLVMGMRTGAVMGSKQHAAAIVLNEIFGASPASKLFLNVRERLSLCYYCSSSYSMLSGNLTVASGIDCANRDVVTSEILAQLEQIKMGNVSDTEFEAARKSLEYSYVQIYDSPFSLQSFYFIRDLFGVCETVEECKERILSVTKEDVYQLARELEYDTCFFINGTLSGEECEVGEDE